jgi:hypothetical protein
MAPTMAPTMSTGGWAGRAVPGSRPRNPPAGRLMSRRHPRRCCRYQASSRRTAGVGFIAAAASRAVARRAVFVLEARPGIGCPPLQAHSARTGSRLPSSIGTGPLRWAGGRVDRTAVRGRCPRGHPERQERRPLTAVALTGPSDESLLLGAVRPGDRVPLGRRGGHGDARQRLGPGSLRWRRDRRSPRLVVRCAADLSARQLTLPGRPGATYDPRAGGRCAWQRAAWTRSP